MEPYREIDSALPLDQELTVFINQPGERPVWLVEVDQVAVKVLDGLVLSDVIFLELRESFAVLKVSVFHAAILVEVGDCERLCPLAILFRVQAGVERGVSLFYDLF